MTHRPLNIKRFEILYYISLLIGVVTSAIMYESMLRQASPLFIAIAQFLTFALMALLIFLIGRKRSKIAKWVLVGMSVFGLVFYIPQLSQMLQVGLAGLLSIVQLCLQAFGLYYLFTDEVKEWMDARKSSSSDSETSSSFLLEIPIVSELKDFWNHMNLVGKLCVIGLLILIIFLLNSNKNPSNPQITSSNIESTSNSYVPLHIVNRSDVPSNIVEYMEKEFNSPQKYSIETVDINLDGKPDYIYKVNDSGWCGTAGCTVVVFISNFSDLYDVAYNQNAHALRISEGTSGVRDIVTYHHRCACDCDSVKAICKVTEYWNGANLVTLYKEGMDTIQ